MCMCRWGLRCTAGILNKGVIRSMTGRSLVGDQLGSLWFHNKQNGTIWDGRRRCDQLDGKQSRLLDWAWQRGQPYWPPCSSSVTCHTESGPAAETFLCMWYRVPEEGHPKWVTGEMRKLGKQGYWGVWALWSVHWEGRGVGGRSCGKDHVWEASYTS
jgi:hypothetical protein